mmetsp:Transcript_2592/g.5927  ORF Transcript_2592/g.5927 Transcript_2592/m.5927 type:complete len:188 (-) Transcript_2592:63-626(-)
MKTLLVEREVAIPEGIEVKVKSCVLTASGERGSLTKNFKHAKMKIMVKDGKVILKKFMSTRRGAAVVRSVSSHISNMFTGLLKGYQYKMRLVYNHFPIQASIEDNGTKVEVRNFVGQKVTKICKLPEGVTCRRSEDVKDELVFEGNSIEDVSQASAQVHQLALVRNKDIRKFLDGIYTSEKGHIIEN